MPLTNALSNILAFVFVRSLINASFLLFFFSHVLLRRHTNNEKLLKDIDSILERQPFSPLIMEEDVSPMDKVPKVELKIETESETRTKMKSNIVDENSN